MTCGNSWIEYPPATSIPSPTGVYLSPVRINIWTTTVCGTITVEVGR